jgi:hypothetical protein
VVKRDLLSWATTLAIWLLVAPFMLQEMFVAAAAASVLLSAGGLVLMSWPESRLSRLVQAEEQNLGQSDVPGMRARGT